jgi:asparagine synthetase B (glutamine-hydrolysing)
LCGIAGFHLRKPNARLDFDPDAMMRDLLLGIDHRGGDATGYAAFGQSGAVQMQKAACAVWPFLKEARKLPEDVRTSILHTRMATQGKAAFPENNHPVVSGDVYVTHNGHVWNDDEPFAWTGAPARAGRVDSEAISASLAWHAWQDAGDALAALDGALAVAAVNAQYPGELVLARGYSSPLCVYVHDAIVVWASTTFVVTEAWRRNIGTAPSWRKVEPLDEGTLLHFYADGSMRTERFGSYRPVYTTGRSFGKYVWPDDDEDDPTSCGIPVGDTKYEVGARLKAALDAARGGVRLSLVEGDGEVEDLDDDPDIQCASCGEWTALSDMRGNVDLLCGDCYDAAPEGMVLR